MLVKFIKKGGSSGLKLISRKDLLKQPEGMLLEENSLRNG